MPAYPVDERLLASIASAYGEIPDTAAVVLGGSRAAGASDSRSDIDVYVYSERLLDVEARSAIAARFGRNNEIDNRFWEPGDECDALDSPLHLDVMLRTQMWIEEQLARVLDQHKASLGYTTCVWYNVLNSRPLFDRSGWFESLQDHSRRPFPEGLRRAIIAKNFPVLGSISSSYIHQLELAVARRDVVSVNHRVAAFIASYFDALFALNRLPHPGEKRLVAYALGTCPILPEHLAADIDSLCSGSMGSEVVPAAKRAERRLSAVLRDERLL